MGERGIRGLKAKMSGSAALEKGARLSSGGIQAGEVRGRSHSVGRCGISRRSRDATGREAPGVRAAKNFESRKESSEHFKWTHLDWRGLQVQHCTDLPSQVTIPAHTEQRKTRQGLG